MRERRRRGGAVVDLQAIGYRNTAVARHIRAFGDKGGRAMFEMGKSYTIRMWEDGEEGGVLADYDNCEVIEIAMPLVKFRQPSNEDVIVNTASLAFVQATLETDEGAESEE